MTKVVIFDIDNTLYSYDDAHEVAFAKLKEYAKEHLGMDAETFVAAHRQANVQVELELGQPCAALHNRLLRYQVLLELTQRPLYPHALNMSKLYWDTLLDVARPYPGAVECLTELKKKGYRLGIGTDMTIDYQLEKLTRMGLLPLIDFVVSSEEVLEEKPSSKIFRACARKGRVSPSECLFIGDSLKKDVLGAQAAGMEAFWFQPDREKALQQPGIPSIQSYDQLRKCLCGE